jgi:hypothetical protein
VCQRVDGGPAIAVVCRMVSNRQKQEQLAALRDKLAGSDNE